MEGKDVRSWISWVKGEEVNVGVVRRGGEMVEGKVGGVRVGKRSEGKGGGCMCLGGGC